MSRGPGWRPRLALILAAGLALRAAWALAPTARNQDDEFGYHGLASTLAERGEFVTERDGAFVPTAQVPPGWPLLLSLPYLAAGPDIRVGRLWTAGLGALLILAAFLLGRQLFGENAGLWAAALAALHPLLVYWSGVAMTETPFALILVLGLWLEVRARAAPLECAASGLVWGLAILMRSTAAPIAAWMAAARALRAWRRREFFAGAAFLAALAVLPLSWAYCNQRRFGRWALDLHGGYTVLIGIMFYPENYIDTPVADAALRRQRWYPEAERLDEAQRDRFFYHKALEFARAHPGVVARDSVVRFVQFWRLVPRSDRPMPALPANRRLLFWVSLLAEGPLFALALGGLALRRRDWRLWCPLAAAGLALTAVHTLTVSQMRYRLPLTPLMAVFAGAALAEAERRWRSA